MRENKYTKLFIVAFTELLLMHGLLIIQQIITLFVSAPFSNSDNYEFIIETFYLISFLLPIAAVLLYMKFTYPEKLKVFLNDGISKCLKFLGFGLLIGFVVNSILCLLTVASSSVSISFQGFNIKLLLVVIPCFIQCSAEEVLLRGYASAYLDDNYKYDTVAFVTGVLFVFHHTSNLKVHGFDSSFVLNIFLLGVILYLLVKVTHSIWSCFGFHTAWNFTQEYIFGMPNSGKSSSIALFKGENAVGSFFCNPVYGNEGTWMCTLTLIICIVVLYRLYNTQLKVTYDNMTPYSF